ncbi:ROK family protein [Oceanibium sediminis]|uniref:ROK family protein n=1 Tax=Oceanibium sediminis TaxID=2026339 RepID=UPI001E425020|nr:ROK family protein [Oceanibium sediminis]
MKQQIFERIRSLGQLSRIEVAKDLGVSAGSVTTLTSELLQDGYLEETRSAPRDVTRGRPKVALQVRRSAGYVAGIKISNEAHTAVVVDFAGRPVGEARLSAEQGAGTLEGLLDAAQKIFAMAVADAGLARGDVSAVGVGLPGMVDHASGIWLWSPLLNERRIPIRDLLTERVGLPVQIDNDVNLLTLAELWYGAGRSVSDFAVVTIEQGVGMGLVLGHNLYRGAHGFGMELGHVKVQLDGALCRCGRRGCLEAYIADYALVREAHVALGLVNRPTGASSSVLLESLYDQAKAGNEAARTIFRRAARFLALTLANVVNLFDPPLIILSGERMRYDYLYEDDTLEEAKTMTLDKGRPDTRIEIHAWGDWVWARGAATLALSALTDARLAGEAA